MAFFCYASHSRAFRVLNLETNQIIETCEVTFDKTQPRSQLVFLSVQVMRNLDRRFSRRGSMNIEMMKTAVWCP
jgi:hypothetical protein